MKRIIVRKKLSLATQITVILIVSLLIYFLLGLLQWEERKNRLQKISKLQMMGMFAYANVQLDEYFVNYAASAEAYRLKLNGLLQIQNTLISKQKDSLGEFFVALSAHTANTSIFNALQNSGTHYFAVSTQIISTIFDMKNFGIVSENEKNQLLAIAYFKLGPNYFNLSREYFSIISNSNSSNLSTNFTKRNKIINTMILYEALVQMHDFYGEYQNSLNMLYKIEELQSSTVKIKLRIAKYLFFSQQYDKAVVVLETGLQKQTSSLNINLEEYLTCGLFLVDLLYFKGQTSRANHYLSLMRYRISNEDSHLPALGEIIFHLDNFSKSRESNNNISPVFSMVNPQQNNFLKEDNNANTEELVKIKVPNFYVLKENML